MSGFKKVLITTLIIASVSIGIGAYIIYDSGLSPWQVGENLRRFFGDSGISVDLGKSVEVKENQSFTLGDKSKLKLSTVHGRIRVEMVEGTDIHLSITGKIPERYKDSYLKIQESADGLEVSLFKGIQNINIGLGSDFDLDILLRVPASYAGDVELSNVSDEINVNGLNGGKITLANVSGDMILEEGTFEHIAFNSVSGTVISYSSAKSVTGETVSGNITATNIGEHFNVKSISGTVNLKSSALLENSQADTVSGDMEVVVENQGNLSYELTSVSGKLKAEHEGSVIQGDKSLSQNNTAGAVKVKLSSVSGKISLKY
ncbi:DUF4097 family beta strand repeat protein [Proteiniclasticum sp. BAD-10]|uniref:DUF4097 family beta strand repeat protein n=1 Tax=Proteiniclasticum sediminis TaxID=2804028 RepID=A0A941HR47_9CLOT|nr:DUF4097 family beta strand repeat-containing protein [Proteiniclasticum sediminis]MBR0575847.1 DUF4097 family beta strand repeat protein [Proteiniclasticum sediminis]